MALTLRLLALLLCVLASMRPSVLFQKKDKQPSSVAFLTDVSKSMTIQDEAGSKDRWRVARETLAAGVKAARSLGPNVAPHTYRFADTLADDKIDDPNPPAGTETAIGMALDEVLKRLRGGKLVAVVLLSDGSSNAGRSPLIEAQRLKSQGVPVLAVGFGSETAGAGSKDVAVRSMNAGPTVYVKNELNVTGMLSVRGFPDQDLVVELFAEGQAAPVARSKVRVRGNATEVAVSGLKWVPQKAGETRLTLKVANQPGELVATNNEFSTFVSVLGGGLNVLYLAGPYNVWEPKFLMRSLDASQKVQVTLKKLVQAASENLDADFAPGAFDVYILGDLPADFLSTTQQTLLARRVTAGAGLVMLGGRYSFGAGGWANTPIGDILPTEVHPGDGQNEPEGGLKVAPNPLGLDSYVLKLARDRGESRRIWDELPPVPGANRLGPAKPGAIVWATDPGNEPIIVAQEAGRGRVLAFGGETWPWARFSEISRLAHVKFWRQTILWLARKEDEGDNQVRLTLDRRRVAVGGKVELTAIARDSKGEPIPGVKYTASVLRDAKDAQPEAVEVWPQGDEGRGAHFVTGKSGDYKVTLTAADASGKTLGSDASRFIAFQDDRELENPAADLTLLRQVAEASGGKFLPPEQLVKYLGTLDKDVVSEYVTQREVRIWDNWYFLLAFAALLSLEWWLRKRHGWV